MNQLIDHAAFVELLADQFPQIAAEIDDVSEGLLHLEMATLARATEAVIHAEDFSTVAAHIKFIDGIFRAAAPDVENAVCVSYLENAFLDASGLNQITARKMLTPILRKALQELEEDYQAMSNSPFGQELSEKQKRMEQK